MTAQQRSAGGSLNAGEGGDGGRLGDASLARWTPLTSWTSVELTRGVSAAPHNVTTADLEPKEHLKPEPGRLQPQDMSKPSFIPTQRRASKGRWNSWFSMDL